VKLLLWLSVPAPFASIVGSWLLSQTTGGDIDLTAYGVAAPFAAICLWLMVRAQKEVVELRAEVRSLNAAMLKREQDLLAGLAPRLYDSALLYREGNRSAAEVSRAAPQTAEPDALRDLSSKVDDLIRRIGEGSP
jgi:hypothetical protein